MNELHSEWNYSTIQHKPKPWEVMTEMWKHPSMDLSTIILAVVFVIVLPLFLVLTNEDGAKGLLLPVVVEVIFLIVFTSLFISHYRTALTGVLFNKFTTANALERTHFTEDLLPPNIAEEAWGGRFLYGAQDHLHSWFIGTYFYNYHPQGESRKVEVTLTLLRAELSRNAPEIGVWADKGLLFSFPHDATFVSLEGDFNKYFSVFATKGKEQEALYVLTPELMARLIDEARGYSFYLKDNVLYVFAPSELRLNHKNFQETFEKLAYLINYFDAEFTDNTKRYIDERTA